VCEDELPDTAALVRAWTRIARPPLNPEFGLHLAEALEPIWNATERHAGGNQPPPFWAFAWPGSQVLARRILDEPRLVRGRRVLDFASGSGLAAVAAVRAGALRVVASDLDPLAQVAQRLNADLNGVTFETTCEDLVGRDLGSLGVDVILAGDVCYERFPAARIGAWLQGLADAGALVLLAEPGRAYAPSSQLELMGTYAVPTSRELESSDTLSTRLWRVTARRQSESI
jgi:predicted nicotinamide N-methyase